MSLDYKSKYIELRSKFIKTSERFYRLGMEEGLKQGQLQAQQEQMAMQQQQQEMMAQGVDPETGQPMQPPMDENGMPMEDQQAEMMQEDPEMMQEEQGSELDQHISELENLVKKGEKPGVVELRKAVKTITDLRKSQKAKMASNHKEVINSKQKDLVDNILKKWEKEANSDSISNNLEEIISSEGFKV
jgi:hypothetical protein